MVIIYYINEYLYISMEFIREVTAMKNSLLILLSLIMMLNSFLYFIAYAEESNEIILPDPVKVVDFSKSFDELAVNDDEFEVVENAAMPEIVYDRKMGKVLKLGKAIIKDREYAQRAGMDYESYIISDNSEYSTIHISNPYVGLAHLVEYEPYEDVKTKKYEYSMQPVWEEGITISYWIKTPAGEDGYGLNSNVVGFTSERFQIQADDYAKYLCTVKYDRDYNKYTEEEKEKLGINLSGVDKDSDFYFQLDEEKTYNNKPLYDYESLGRIYWMNKNFANGYVKYDDGTIYTCESISRFNPSVDNYLTYSNVPYLGSTEDDHDPGTSKLRYAWTYSEMWLDASSSFYFENDNQYTNKQLNPNHEDTYGTIMGMHALNCFNINSWKDALTLPEADRQGLAGPSPCYYPDQWHFVTCVIQNDWVKYYMDGKEIDIEEYYSSYGTLSVASVSGYKPWKLFNKGTGARYGYGTYMADTKWCYDGKYCSPTIMEWIILDCVNLTIGGGNRNGDAYVMYAETDEILIKNVVFYDTILTDQQIKYLATEPNYYGAEYTGKLGDANNDQKVSIRDALAILKHSAGIEILDDENICLANVNDDDLIDADDALQVLKYIAKLIRVL